VIGPRKTSPYFGTTFAFIFSPIVKENSDSGSLSILLQFKTCQAQSILTILPSWEIVYENIWGMMSHLWLFISRLLNKFQTWKKSLLFQTNIAKKWKQAINFTIWASIKIYSNINEKGIIIIIIIIILCSIDSGDVDAQPTPL